MGICSSFGIKFQLFARQTNDIQWVARIGTWNPEGVESDLEAEIWGSSAYGQHLKLWE